MEPTYHLEGIIHTKEEMADFEGPLNLILMLLSKNKIEIRDIRVSDILEQYLAYLAQMEAMDLEVTSEFVQMASYLLYIKTKMLLASQEEEVSELELLISSLEQLRARDRLAGVRELTPYFQQASERGARLYTKPPELLKTTGEYRYRHESYELLRALAAVYSRSRAARDAEQSSAPRRRIVPRRIVYKVRDKSREILERFRGGGTLPLRRLYAESQSRSELVATFLSVLELCSVGDVQLTLEGNDVLLSFAGGSIEGALENIDTFS